MGDLTAVVFKVLPLFLPCFIGRCSADNIFLPNSNSTTTTNPPTRAPTYDLNNSSNAAVTITNVTSNSGFSVESLGDDWMEGPGILLEPPQAWVKDEIVYFRTRIYNESFRLMEETTTKEFRDAVLRSEMWSYDGDEWRLLCQIDGYNDFNPKFYLLRDKVYFTGDFEDGGRLLACNNTTLEVIHPALGVFNLVQLSGTGKLFFVGYETQDDLNNQRKTLFVSDGTVEGTIKVMDRTVRQIETISPGGIAKYVGDIEPLADGMPVVLFHVDDEGFWVTDGTSEGTRPFSDEKRIDDISDSFNGGKFLIRAGYSGTMVTNWDNETIVLRDDIRLDDSLKLNDTHMLFTGLPDSGVWMTDGTIAGTGRLITTKDEGEFRFFRNYGNKLASITFRSGPRDNTTTYFTDGTVAGTRSERLRDSFPFIDAMTWTFLPDGRAVVVPNESYNNSRLLITVDHLNRQVLYIEDINVPGNIAAHLIPTKNDTILFFAKNDSEGWMPWKMTYPPSTPEEISSSNNISKSNQTSKITMPPTEVSTESPLMPLPSEDAPGSFVVDMTAEETKVPELPASGAGLSSTSACVCAVFLAWALTVWLG